MKYYQAELHCHTKEVSPCSRIPAKYLINGYQEAGYRYVFTIDHYHPEVFEVPKLKRKSWKEKIDYFWNGYEHALKAAEGTGITVLPGMEVALGIDQESGLGSDFLVYGFTREFLYDEPYLYRFSFQDFYRKMHENGFLVFQAHPYRYGLTPVEPVCYDGIEIVNTHPRHFSRNKLAIEFAAEHDLLMIGGSDAHSEEDVGRGGVMLPDGIHSAQEFVRFIRENGSPELIVTFGA